MCSKLRCTRRSTRRLHFRFLADGRREFNQASQLCPQRRPLTVFEPAGLDGTRTATKRIFIYAFQQETLRVMALEIGIVGLPNVGKSTIFNALTAAGALAANYPFATIEPNVGVVAVPDDRLKIINQFQETEKIVPASLRVVDIAGIVRGASTGEGLGK